MTNHGLPFLLSFLPFSTPPCLVEAHSCWKKKAISHKFWVWNIGCINYVWENDITSEYWIINMNFSFVWQTCREFEGQWYRGRFHKAVGSRWSRVLKMVWKLRSHGIFLSKKMWQKEKKLERDNYVEVERWKISWVNILKKVK